MEQLFGQSIGNKAKAFLDQYSASLGEANYLDRNEESLEVSSLFMKLATDLSGQVCSAALTEDQAQADLSKRQIMLAPDDPAKTLRALRLKLHAIWVDENSTVGIEKLQLLYTKALSAAESAKQSDPKAWAWHVVCVAMLTDPQFLAY
jgi:hypothetical protein